MKATPYVLGISDKAFDLAGCDETEVALAIAHNLGLLVLEHRAALDLKRDQWAEAQKQAKDIVSRIGK